MVGHHGKILMERHFMKMRDKRLFKSINFSIKIRFSMKNIVNKITKNKRIISSSFLILMIVLLYIQYFVFYIIPVWKDISITVTNTPWLNDIICFFIAFSTI